ncbi:MAG: uncharacterized protein KVP18_000559 [Porospora cf. gigantea A]|uniref:uncharacterized protein n=1 Tax=Porospora cf. gigantea A TaxID=2853593 RepID=UPI003559AF07|nr:MAG: hypothetical protein KVP18_000559 [Porospora cf. gigantea A]
MSPGPVTSSLDQERSHKRKSASDGRKCQRKKLYRSESKESRMRRLLMAEGQQFVPATALSTKVESVESERKNPTTLKPSTSPKKGDVEAELPKLKPSTSPKKPVWNEPFGILITSNDEPVKSEGPLDPRQSTQLYTPDWRNRVSSGAVKSSLDLKRKSASGMRQCRRKVLLKSESKESRVRRLLMAEGQQFVPASHQAALSTKVESVESERKNPTTLKPSTSQKKGDVEAELPKLKPSTSPKKPVWNEPFGILVTSE